MTTAAQKLHRTGDLGVIARELVSALSECRLCPHECAIDRLAGQTGKCRTGRLAGVANAQPHFGEEPFISGTRGSGTIFFESCNLRCRFCQNWQLSHKPPEHLVSKEELAAIMLKLEDAGCHNVNLVTPTHVAPQILEALALAVNKGFGLPLVWNANAYESRRLIEIIAPAIDIFLEDFKYSSGVLAHELSDAPDYPAAATAALAAASGVAGDLEFDLDGIATRGMHIRHLVLPGQVGNSVNALRVIAQTLGTGTWISLMSQYHPCHEAVGDPALGRTLAADEYERVLATAEELGFENVLVQRLESHCDKLPDFRRDDPFADR